MQTETRKGPQGGDGFTHERAYEGKTNTWLTPKYITDALGPFDLDPCVAPSPRPWSVATRHIELPEDGLAADWSGGFESEPPPKPFVWCNPPYGPHTPKWLARMADHGNGIALVFARTETKAFHESVWRRAHACLFLRGRLKFCLPDGTEGGTSTAPSVLVAYGEEAAGCLNLASMGHGPIKGYLVRLR